MRLFKFTLTLISIFFYSFILLALEETKISIKGNTYVDNEIILSLIKDIKDLSNEELVNTISKKLYETGNFQNVEVEFTNKDIIIILTEHPRINKVNFKKNKRFNKEDLQIIYDQIITTNFFNPNLIDLYINELNSLYKSFGYNQIKIDYNKTFLKDSNFINIDFIINEGKISKINQVYFIGNNNFSKSELFDVIKMKPKRDILFFLRKNYKEFQADNDILRIKKLYLNNGFRNINVNIKKEYISKKNRFNLYFFIEEGIKYEFNNIDLSNNLLNISDDQKEYIKFILKDYRNSQIKNNIYNKSHTLNIKSQISDYLFNQGSKFFKISILEQINDDKIDIRYDINPIEPKYVNIINIFGNTRTLDKVVRRELRFAEGDPLNPELITSATKDLQRLNIFKNIEIKENFFNDEKSNIDIYLEEKPTGDFSVGASFGSFEGAVFVASLKENNIGGTGKAVSFNINTSDTNTLYSFDVKEPHFTNIKMNLIYGLKYRNNDYSKTASYNLNSFNSNIGVQYELIDNLLHNLSLSYELNDYEITDSSAVSSSILSSEGTNSVIKINNLLQYNKLNSFLRPTDGYLIRLNSILSPITNSSDGFIKNIITGKKYIKLNKNIVSIQSRLGNITSLQNDTVVENNKFSLGGRWLRGFDNYGAGPRNSRTSYVGGNNLFVTKIDFSRPLYSNTDNPIDVYFFTDFGTVYGNKDEPTFSDSAIRSSFGYGIKFYSLIGPIGFSWAFPISDETYDIKRMFLFSIGNLN